MTEIESFLDQLVASGNPPGVSVVGVIFDTFTTDTGISPYLTTEFGIRLALVGVVMALLFWRLANRDARTNPIPAMLPEQARNPSMPLGWIWPFGIDGKLADLAGLKRKAALARCCP